jgi:hypothetical protein
VSVLGSLGKWFKKKLDEGGNVAQGVARQVNIRDGGATYSNPRPQQRPVQQAPQQRQPIQQPVKIAPVQQFNPIQVSPVRNPSMSIGSAPKASPMQVRTAPQQQLRIGNQNIAPNPQARTAPPNNQSFASKAFDQVNPLDNGRTWQQRRPTTNANSFQQLKSVSSNVNKNFIQPGIVQPAVRATNMINETPIGRLSGVPSQSRMVDVLASQQKDPRIASAIRTKGYQKVLDNAGIGINDSKATIGRKAVSDIGGTASNFIPIGKTAGIVSMGAKAGAKQLAKVSAQSAVAGGIGGGLATARDTTNPVEILKGAGMGAAFGGALPVAGFGAGAVVRGGAKVAKVPATKLVNKVVETPELSPQQLGQRNDLVAQRSVAELRKPGVIPQIDQQINAIDSLNKPRLRNPLKPLNEGGYAKIPGGKNDPAPELSVPQKQMINDYANMLEDMGQGNGIDILPNGSRVSNNFRTANNKGKAMSKADWFDQARQDLESGKAGFGASDEYRKLPTAPVLPSNNSKLQSPQQASPIDQLDTRTENIPQLNDTLLPDGAKPLPNRVPARMSSAERNNLYQNVPEGTERTIKVNNPNTERNIPVRQMNRDGDVMTATNVNPNIKKGEKRYSVDKDGELIEDRKGATSLFTDDEGRVKGFRVGKEYFDAKDLGDLSDVNGYGSMAATMRRNAERGFGKETGEKVSKFLVDHQQAQATKMIERHVALTKGLKDQANELGISFSGNSKKAKNVSKAIQDFGEGNRTKAELVQEFGSDYAGKIVKADKWFKSQYDSLLDEMNTTLKQFGYDPVPKRKNYYTHFQEPKLWESFGLKMQELRDISGKPTMQDSNPMAARGQISNKLAGQSEFTAPNKRFNRFALKRTGNQYTSDAFKSFEIYLSPTLNNIYMTPSIARARVLTRAVAQDADIMGKDANNIIVQTREWANRLAGKSNRLGDRVLSDSMSGAKLLAASQWVQRKAGANTIVGNLSTAVMQPVVLTQTAGKFGYKNTILGAIQEMSTAHAKNSPIRQSEFLRRRYANTTPVTASKKDIGGDVLNTPLKVVEQTAVRITWNSAYNDALAKGLKGKKAIQYADVNTEKTVAGRSIGERPELYESKSAAMLTMYQLEVNNYWQQFGKEMTKAQAAKTLVAAYAFNLLLQQATGRQVGFNPIDTAIQTYKETQKDEKSKDQKAKSIGQLWAGEVVDNAPLIGPAINLVIGDQNMKKVFGPSTNVGRFGVGSPFSAIASTTKVKFGDKTVQIPQNVILPYAGNQVKKTVEGGQALWNQKMTDKKGDTTVNVKRTPANIARGLAFGPSAIPEVNKYYNNLGKKKYDQTEVPNQIVSKAGSQGLGGLTKDQQEQYQALPASKRESFKAESLAKNKVSRDNKAKGIKITKQSTSKPSAEDYYKVKDAEYNDFKNKYDADKKAGKITALQDIDRQRKLKKLEIGAKYDKEARDLWGKSKSTVFQYISNQPPDKAKALTDQLTAYDNELYQAGVAKYATFRNGIAPKRGGRRTARGKGRGGRVRVARGKGRGRGRKGGGKTAKSSAPKGVKLTGGAKLDSNYKVNRIKLSNAKAPTGNLKKPTVRVAKKVAASKIKIGGGKIQSKMI